MYKKLKFIIYVVEAYTSGSNSLCHTPLILIIPTGTKYAKWLMYT